MTTLLVRVDAQPSAAQACAWALVAGDARTATRGHALLQALPPADATVAILDAALVQVATLRLPPIAPSRLGAAVRYALEERVAAPIDSLRIVHGAQAADGSVRVVAASASLLDALDGALRNLRRVLALPSLAMPPGAGEWRWIGDGGFVLRADGSARPVGAGARPGDAPATQPAGELLLALRDARRAGDAPRRIVLQAARGEPAQAAPASIEGVPVVEEAAWDWDHEGIARAMRDEALPDLSSRSAALGAPASRRGAADRARLRRAGVLAILAAGVFALGALATAGWLALEQRRDEARAIALAREAGAEAADFDTAMIAIARRDAQARHARGELAPDDALPLLARAAPALAGLPAGSLRRASYAGGAWTLEVGALDEAARGALAARLGEAGLTALSAQSAGMTRVRIQR